LGSPFGRQNRPLDPMVPALCRALMSAHRVSPKGSKEQSVWAVRTGMGKGTCMVLAAYVILIYVSLHNSTHTDTHRNKHRDISRY
jgi:hypothetical protein